MAESERNGETQNGSSLQMNTVSSSRDLLQRFISETHFPQKFPEAKRGEEEGILELSLGLSLNGRFGVDRKRPETLIRSSSISDFNLMDDDGNRGSRGSPVSGYSAAWAAAAIARTCSLPTEPAEEWRKRKEMQCMRRMDAKRRRLEKLKSVVRPPQPPPALAPRDPANSEEENGDENGGLRRQGSVIIDGIEGLPQTPQPLSQQGSIGSQGSGSSGISESESQPIQATNKPNKARSPASVQSLPHKNEQKPLLNRGSTLPGKFSIAPVERTSMKVKSSENGAKETARNPISDMPFVSTRGDGPNGKRIEGFLYRYRNGDEVKIVCVCHGSFLSPAEFVKHAGGGDVTHPLRHIVVSPPLLLK